MNLRDMASRRRATRYDARSRTCRNIQGSYTRIRSLQPIVQEGNTPYTNCTMCFVFRIPVYKTDKYFSGHSHTRGGVRSMIYKSF